MVTKQATLVVAFVSFFGLTGAVDPVGCDCNPNTGDDADIQDAGMDAHTPVDASTDAVTADVNGTDTISHDGGLDASPTDAGDPCGQYLPLIDDQEWNCGSGAFTCVWQMQREGSNCYLYCPGHLSLEWVREGQWQYTEITATTVTVCNIDCSSTVVCTSPPSSDAG